MEIPLRNRKQEIVGYTIVDESDYEVLSKQKLHLDGKGYAANAKSESIHRMLMNAQRGQIVDHINGNKLDNRRANLRIATAKQNGQNRKKKPGTLSKYIGVRAGKGFFSAQCVKYLGVYKTEEAAGQAYDIFVFHNYGQNARTNGLITYEEAMKLTPFSTNKEPRDLPENIGFEYGKYYVQIRYKGKRYKKFGFTSVEEAQEQLNIFTREIEQLKNREKEKIYSREITRNQDGIAFFTVKGNECLIDDDLWHEYSIKGFSVIQERYLTLKVDGKTTRFHHMILPAEANQVVDHINGNTFDNRRCNLRYATHNLNSQNRDKMKVSHAVSSYKGVSLELRHENRIWVARCGLDRKTVCIGTYYSEIEAARAYNKKMIEIYKGEARLNQFPVTKNGEGIPFLKINREEYLFDEDTWEAVSLLSLQKCHNGFALYKDHSKLMYVHYLLHPPPEGLGVVHVNGNIRDNRLCNLQHVSLEEMPKYPKPTTYYCVCPQGKRFLVRITYEGKRHKIGYYDSAEEAAKAYNEKAYEWFGDDAELNFIPYL